MKTNYYGIALASLVTALLLTACGGGGGGGGGGSPQPAGPYSISGAVNIAANSTPNAVALNLTGTASTSVNADASGNYSFTGLANGNYTITPSLTGYTFNPASLPVAISGVSATAQNFVLTFSVASVTDPLVAQQWGLRNTAQNGYADTTGVANDAAGTLGTDINANPVYTTYGHTGKGVIVAVVDSGLEIAHEDLAANVVPNGSWNFINSNTDPTPDPATTASDHGTMVSGLIAMAMNGKGGIGVAPKAQLKGFNFLGGATTQTAANRLASLGGSTASPNSSDVFIFNQSFGTGNAVDFPMDTATETQYASGTSTLRGGKGALYVKSAGNGFIGNANFPNGTCSFGVSPGNNLPGISCQNANFDPSNTLPYNIVMAALNAKGTRASYSTAGSAIWASTPGGQTGFNAAAITQAGFVPPAAPNVIYDPAMVTTDRSGCTNGESVNTTPSGSGPFSFFNWGGANLGGINTNCNYTNGMNGTSSAAPMMSGAIALILEANPALTWREVKDILARTAVKVDAGILPVNVTLSNGTYVAEQGWITNTAGLNFHNWYGFGAANAGAAVTMAKTYVSGSLGTFANTGWVAGTVPVAPANLVADNSITGVSVPIAVAAGTGGVNTVEAVQIQVTTSAVATAAGCSTATAGCTGDIGIELTSPSGTKSILKNARDGFNGTNFAGMVLASNAFYGEASAGTWTVKVVDAWAGSGNQTLTNVGIRIYGH